MDPIKAFVTNATETAVTILNNSENEVRAPASVRARACSLTDPKPLRLDRSTDAARRPNPFESSVAETNPAASTSEKMRRLPEAANMIHRTAQPGIMTDPSSARDGLDSSRTIAPELSA